MPELERVSRDADPDVRLKAIEAVLNIRPPTWQSRPFFTQALSDSSAEVRMAAAYSLGALKGEAAPSLAALTGVLSDSDPGVRRAGVFALGEIGPPASEALGKLRSLERTDTSAVVRGQLADAIARIEGRPVPEKELREPTQAEKCAASRNSAPGCR